MAIKPKDLITGVVERGRKVVSEATGRLRGDHDDKPDTTAETPAPAPRAGGTKTGAPAVEPDAHGAHACCRHERAHAEGGREERAEVGDREAEGREAEGEHRDEGEGRHRRGQAEGGHGVQGRRHSGDRREAEGRHRGQEARRGQEGREAEVRLARGRQGAGVEADDPG